LTAYLEGMRRYAEFTGRSSVSQFWQFLVTLLAVTFAVAIADTRLAQEFPTKFGVLTLIILLPHLVPLAAVTVRRLHDTGRTGWWAILALIPFINVASFLQAALPSTTGQNQFGDAVATDAPGSSWNIDYIKPDHRKGTSVAASTSNPAAAAGTEAIVDQLERLAALHASGAIDEAEFARIKAQLLP